MDEEQREMFEMLSHTRIRMVWETAQLGDELGDEDARLVKVMREHPQYAHLWERSDELSDAEIEIDGVSPVMHIIVHHIAENQIAEGDPSETSRTLKALMRRGVSRHNAIHAIGNVLMDEIFHVSRDKRAFDERRFVRMLRKTVRDANKWK